MHVFQPRYFIRKTPEHFKSFNAFWKFLRLAKPAWDLSFSFFGGGEGGLFWVLLFATIRSSPSLEIGGFAPPPPPPDSISELS